MVNIGSRIPLLARVMLVEEASVGLHVTIKHKAGEYELYAWDRVAFVRQYQDAPTGPSSAPDSFVSSVHGFIAKAIRGAKTTQEDRQRQAANDLYRDGLTDDQIRAEYVADEEP